MRRLATYGMQDALETKLKMQHTLCTDRNRWGMDEFQEGWDLKSQP